MSFEPAGSRSIACVDPVAEINVLPLPGNLFGQVQDEALRKSALDYYLFLSKVELQALTGRQAIFSSYGANSLAPVSMIPTIQNFDTAASTFASGHLWGQISHAPAAGPSVATSLPGLTITPFSSATAYASNTNAAGVASLGSMAGGIGFPAINSPNHKIGL